MSDKAEKGDKAAEAPPPAKSSFSLMNIIILVAFLAIVVGVECAIASYMIPSAEDVAKMAEANFALKTPPGLAEHGEFDEGALEGEGEGEHAGGEEEGEQGAEEASEEGGHGGGGGEAEAASKGYSVEVSLGDFSVRTTQPGQNSTKRIDFKLYGTLIDHDQGRFKAAYKRNEHRIRDSVLVIVRNSEETDLSDPSLGLLKRRILEKSNRLLGKPYLKAIVFSEFSFIEQ